MKKLLLIHNSYRQQGGEDIAVINELELLNNNFNTDDVVVVLLHDSGSRYIGKVYNDDWMKKNGFKLD